MSYIEISTNTTWTITGPVWVNNLPITGSGNINFNPTCTVNATGNYRSGDITITYADATTSTVTILQYAEEFVSGKIFVKGMDQDEGQKVHFEVISPDDSIDSENTACGGFIDISSNPQTGIIPVTGDDITVYVYAQDYTHEAKPFLPVFNNKVQYLFSPDPYETADEVIANGALDLSMVYNGVDERFEGTFTYTRDDYFYIVIDMTNSLDCGTGSQVLGGIGSFYPFNAKLLYGETTTGNAEFVYTTTNLENIMSAVYNNSLIAYVTNDTTTVTFNFVKNVLADGEVIISVTNPDGVILDDIEIGGTCPSLTSFEISTDPFNTAGSACAWLGAFDTVYHNGTTTIPVAGDTVYSDIDGITLFDGDSKYYFESTDGVAILIGSDGMVVSVTSCTCDEVAIPVITVSAFYINIGETPSFNIEVTNNPTSWSLCTDVSMVTFNGNDTGGTYHYDDIEGCQILMSIGIGETVTIPVTDGTIVGVDVQESTYEVGEVYVPYGLFLGDNGQIQTNFTETGTYSISVMATNCFGDSVCTQISFLVAPPVTLKPFRMSSQGQCSSELACADTTCYDTFWFDGSGCDDVPCLVPQINDFIFVDGYKNTYFNGGYLYYGLEADGFLLIDGTGQVVLKSDSCA